MKKVTKKKSVVGDSRELILALDALCSEKEFRKMCYLTHWRLL